jgi:hypothetical protein
MPLPCVLLLQNNYLFAFETGHCTFEQQDYFSDHVLVTADAWRSPEPVLLPGMLPYMECLVCVINSSSKYVKVGRVGHSSQRNGTYHK